MDCESRSDYQYPPYFPIFSTMNLYSKSIVRFFFLLLVALLLQPKSLLAQTKKGLDDKINEAVEPLTELIESVVFFTVPITSEIAVPFVLILLLFGALFCTLYFGFPNLRYFRTSIDIVRGKYDDPDDVGEVSHFQALTAALSGTVGLGNIAGVAVAIGAGGPGATFWMILAGLFGMSSKFAECTLGVKYRDVDENGTVYGGPMYYLTKGLKDLGYVGFGRFLAIFFAIMCVGGSFGGGNMFQVNQAAAQVKSLLAIETGAFGVIFGSVVALLVGLVILGGIKRIANVTDKLVPFMVGVYLLVSVTILVMFGEFIPSAFQAILDGAFSGKSVAGGIIGVMIQGFRRAAFSNEAGVGSAAIAHSAVKTNDPASEGLVALLEPFIDTVVVCTMTALVLIITQGQMDIDGGLEGVDLTSAVWASAIPGSQYVLTLAVVLFAFSTMISWSYYGLQSWKFLFGRSKLADRGYKLLFCGFVVVGAAVSLDAVIGFSDAMIFAMVFPNMIGLFILAPVVRKELASYIQKIKEKG